MSVSQVPQSSNAAQTSSSFAVAREVFTEEVIQGFLEAKIRDIYERVMKTVLEEDPLCSGWEGEKKALVKSVLANKCVTAVYEMNSSDEEKFKVSWDNLFVFASSFRTTSREKTDEKIAENCRQCVEKVRDIFANFMRNDVDAAKYAMKSYFESVGGAIARGDKEAIKLYFSRIEAIMNLEKPNAIQKIEWMNSVLFFYASAGMTNDVDRILSKIVEDCLKLQSNWVNFGTLSATFSKIYRENLVFFEEAALRGLEKINEIVDKSDNIQLQRFRAIMMVNLWESVGITNYNKGCPLSPLLLKQTEKWLPRAEEFITLLDDQKDKCAACLYLGKIYIYRNEAEKAKSFLDKGKEFCDVREILSKVVSQMNSVPIVQKFMLHAPFFLHL